MLGITGISVDLHWGLIEVGAEPGSYNWSGYKTLLRLISDFGFKIKVRFRYFPQAWESG